MIPFHVRHGVGIVVGHRHALAQVPYIFLGFPYHRLVVVGAVHVAEAVVVDKDARVVAGPTTRIQQPQVVRGQGGPLSLTLGNTGPLVAGGDAAPLTPIGHRLTTRTAGGFSIPSCSRMPGILEELGIEKMRIKKPFLGEGRVIYEMGSLLCETNRATQGGIGFCLDIVILVRVRHSLLSFVLVSSEGLLERRSDEGVQLELRTYPEKTQFKHNTNGPFSYLH